MNNHSNADTKDIHISESKNTIFIKKEVDIKKKASKNQSNPNNDITDNFAPDDTVSTNKQKNKASSTKKYDIDSLSDSDEDYDDESCMILSLQDIIKSIPATATKIPSTDLQKTHTEWRWRFFDLKGRKLIEISKMIPKSKRIYMDNKGKWTEYTLKKEWDKFLVDTRYCYVEN